MRTVCYILFFLCFVNSQAQDVFSTVRLQDDEKVTENRATLDSCIRVGFERDSAYYYRSLLHLKMGATALALNDIAKLVHDYSNFEATDYVYALYYFNVQDYGQCVAKLNKAIKRDPKNIKALYNRAIVSGMLDDYKGAVEDLSVCIQLSPANAQYYYSRAYWHELSGKYKEAIDDYEKAISINPKLFDAYFGAANCYRLEKNNEAACKTIDRAEQAGSQIAVDARAIYCKY